MLRLPIKAHKGKQYVICPRATWEPGKPDTFRERLPSIAQCGKCDMFVGVEIGFLNCGYERIYP
jgi:hypothetical protein